MSTLWEVVEPILARHTEVDVRAFHDVIGPELIADLSQLSPERRADLVDRLVRNLRTVSVANGPGLQRELFQATLAAPLPEYRWELGSATALVRLRTGLRYLATWLGYDWHELTLLQGAICNLARWVQANGKGLLDAHVDRTRACFTLRFAVPGVDAKTAQAAPLVMAVRELTSGFSARDDEDGVVLDFCLNER